jgi:hypothetical protein
VISHHIYYSIWSSINNDFDSINHNIVWQLGFGNNVNFLLDSWCGAPIASQLNILVQLHPHLTARASHFIVNLQWNIPYSLLISFPKMKQLVEQVTIPI